jgi:hypothetical protein
MSAAMMSSRLLLNIHAHFHAKCDTYFTAKSPWRTSESHFILGEGKDYSDIPKDVRILV